MARAQLTALLVALLGVGVGLYWYMKPPTTRFILALKAVSEDEALIATRRNEDNATYFWVELHSKSQGVRWIVNTGELEVATSLGFAGLAADNERVYIMLEDDPFQSTKTEVWALQRETGQILWKAPISMMGTPYTDFLYVQGDAVALNGIESVFASAFDTKTGKPLWQNDLGKTGQSMALNDSLYLYSTMGFQRLSLADGIKHQNIEKNNCFLGDSFLVKDKEELSMLALNGSSEKIRAVVDPRLSSIGECWRYQNHIIVMSDNYPHTSLNALDEKTGDIVWSLFLENTWVISQHTNLDNAKQSPRYAPIELLTRNGETIGEHRLAFIDLEEGKVSFIEPPHFVSSSISRIGDTWLVVNSSELIVLNGKTGELVSAWKAKWNLDKLNSASLIGGLLWLPGNEWATSAKLPWAIFDLAQAKPAQTRGEMELQEITAQWGPLFSQKKPLGIPTPQSAPTSSPASAPASTQATSLP